MNLLPNLSESSPSLHPDEWLLDQLDEAIALFSSDHHLLFANAAFLRLCDFEQDWVGDRVPWVQVLLHLSQQVYGLQEQHEAIDRAFQKVARSPNTPLTLTPLFCDLSLRFAAHPNGSILLTLSPGAKVAQLKEALASSEERWQILVSSHIDNIWDWDIQQHEIFLSEQLWDTLNLLPDIGKVPEQEWFNRIHPDDLLDLKANIDRHLLQKSPDYQTEFRIAQQDGSYRWFSCQGRALWDAAQTPIRLISICTDITAQKQQETQLRMLESVVINAYESILVTEAKPLDPPGPKIIYVNPAFTRTTGYWPEDVIGKTPRILQGPATSRETLARLRDALDSEEPIVVELENYRKDGSTFWVELSAVPIFNGGELTHWVSMYHDITQRKQIEAELLRTLQKQREINELRSHFVSMTSHEFRTPLTSILASAELLEHCSDSWTPEENLEHLHLIQSAVQHLNQMLDEILMIDQTETGDFQLSPTWFNIFQFCHNLAGVIQMGVGRQQLIIFTHKLQSSDGLDVYLDKKLVQRILTNLLSNAAKYSDEGSVIELHVAKEKNSLIFQISDEGIGIHADDLRRLFDFFYRGKNVEGIPGTGLGLAMVKTCVDRCKGQIHVESQVGVGTRFQVKLPTQFRSSVYPDSSSKADGTMLTQSQNGGFCGE